MITIGGMRDQVEWGHEARVNQYLVKLEEDFHQQNHNIQIRSKHVLFQIMFFHCISIISLLYSYSYDFSASNELNISQIGFQNLQFVYKIDFSIIFTKRKPWFSSNMDLLNRPFFPWVPPTTHFFATSL